MTRPLLLTVPFSHFCEKARWALDRAAVDYVEEGHIPGFHRIAVTRLKNKGASVPILVVDGRTLEDSSDILAWADGKGRETGKGREIYPRDEALKREVLALEDTLDEELGPHIRRVLYFHILPNPNVAFGLMDQHTPLWQRTALRIGFPLLARGMRRFMKIDPTTAAESLTRVNRLLDEMDARLKDGRRYLVGDRFTAADLTLASLAGPAVRPEGHYVRFPSMSDLSAPAAAILGEVAARPVGEYIRRLYREDRR